MPTCLVIRQSAAASLDSVGVEPRSDKGVSGMERGVSGKLLVVPGVLGVPTFDASGVLMHVGLW